MSHFTEESPPTQLMENILYDTQESSKKKKIGVIKQSIRIDESTILQFRYRCCNHDSEPHINTSMILYMDGNKHGKCLDRIGDCEKGPLVWYIAHRIDTSEKYKRGKNQDK